MVVKKTLTGGYDFRVRDEIAQCGRPVFLDPVCVCKTDKRINANNCAAPFLLALPYHGRVLRSLATILTRLF